MKAMVHATLGAWLQLSPAEDTSDRERGAHVTVHAKGRDLRRFSNRVTRSPRDRSETRDRGARGSIERRLNGHTTPGAGVARSAEASPRVVNRAAVQLLPPQGEKVAGNTTRRERSP
jgi:hypothetical protein